MSRYYDRIEQEMKESLKQLQRQRRTRRNGRRGRVEVYYEPETADESTVDQREESQQGIKQLAEISREFLKMRKVYRWHLTKISDFDDTSVIRVCHFFVEENRLNDEWKQFRKSRETY